MTRILPGVLAMAIIVVASNILVQHLLGDWLTWGAITYPFAFLVTDVMNRLYGAASARKVVIAGFVVGVICSLIGTQIMGEYGPLVTLRVAVGSGTAFLIAQLMDVFVFNKLRDGAWWKAPLGSSVIGSALDTAIFFSVAFAASFTFFGAGETEAAAWASETVPLLGVGPLAPLWVSLAVADWGCKLALSLIALVPFRLIIQRFTGMKATANA
ncbi:Inner membrane protein YhhQ [Aquimixticola soesokkakensis]|uniref:Probable queuosine precursor transporter n=1 Tax=Aquimixticola soesokkakensis TaxID=1519096 RepID=A0A1Y5RE89_9RHOB|nr:queuosine precursor transporter [Aquimixticola soesokkakensis]SLN15042.1 Inner membrane protein YhhQ [Aquimixticola soesokkakensis]